jgi:hypothetical protein
MARSLRPAWIWSALVAFTGAACSLVQANAINWLSYMLVLTDGCHRVAADARLEPMLAAVVTTLWLPLWGSMSAGGWATSQPRAWFNLQIGFVLLALLAISLVVGIEVLLSWEDIQQMPFPGVGVAMHMAPTIPPLLWFGAALVLRRRTPPGALRRRHGLAIGFMTAMLTVAVPAVVLVGLSDGCLLTELLPTVRLW